MKKLSVFAFVCLILLPALSFGQRLSVRAVTARPLKPLNMAAFNTQLSNAVTRQSFLQLLRSSQVAQLSYPEQTLLLAYKFVEETHQLPRTVISVNNQILPSEKYNAAQKMEINLGNRIRNAIQSPTTPIKIKRELLELQYTFSPHYQAARVLENLNEWITNYHSWPRNTIEPEGPLTPEEQYEIELAKSVNKITDKSNLLSDDLVAQINVVRSYYDPQYVSTQQKEEMQQARKLEKEERFRQWDIRQSEAERYYSSTTESYNPKSDLNFFFLPSGSIPFDVAPTTSQPFPSPEQLIEKKFSPLPIGTARNIAARLKSWLTTHDKWPVALRPEQSLGKASLAAIEEDIFFQDVVRFQQEYPGVIEFIYTAWKDKEMDLLDSLLISTDPAEQKRVFTDIEYYQNTKSPIYLAQLLKEGIPYSSDVLRDLNSWVQMHHHWPTDTWEPPYTYAMYKETVLARQLERKLRRLVPQEQRSWKLNRILGSSRNYRDPELEQFRQLYQQYHK